MGEEYQEPRIIRGDTTVFLGLKIIEKSGLTTGDKVVVRTSGEKRIIIEAI